VIKEIASSRAAVVVACCCAARIFRGNNTPTRLRTLAEEGDGFAQYDMARHLLHTIKKDSDFADIAYWLLKAAEQGVSKAQIDLGVTLNMPDKSWHDPVGALKWFNAGMALVLTKVQMVVRTATLRLPLTMHFNCRKH